MWIHDKGKDGTYYEERVTDAQGRQRILSVKIADGSRRAKREAQEALREKVEAYQAEQTAPDRMSLSVVAGVYNREQKATLRPSTCQRNSCTLRTIIGIVGDVDINTLTAGAIREKLLGTGKGAGTINQYIKRFKGFLRWAYQNDYLMSSDVYEKLSYLKDIPHKAKIAEKYLEADELTALIASMDVPRWRLLTEFLALSGLRIGEALALDRDDIDMDYIHVYKTIQIGSGEIGDAKTLSSVRDVYIQPELADCLKKIDKAMKEQRKATRYTPTPYLFEGLDGGRAEYRAYNKYLKKRSKAVLGREISPHALRHTHTSLLAAAGVPFDVISRRLGHENSCITREIYFHITGGLRLADASKMSKVSLLAVGSAVGNASEPRKIRKVY